MASSLVLPTQTDAVKREAEKYQQILSVEAELESKRLVAKIAALMGNVYDDCDRSQTKAFKENLKLLTAVISKDQTVDEVWIKKEKDRLNRAKSDQEMVLKPETSRKAPTEVSETPRTQGREVLSSSAVSARSSASCSRVIRHQKSQMESEVRSTQPEETTARGGARFPKEPRGKVEVPDNKLGPGQYDPHYRLTTSRSMSAFNTSGQRMKDFSNREISPGPAYSPKYNFLSK